MSDKKNLNWAISVLEAQAGTGRPLWKAKAKEVRRQRIETRRAKRTHQDPAAKAPAATPTPEETAATEAKLQALRKEKAKRKLFAIRKRSKALVSKLVLFEQKRLKRKIKQMEAKLEEPADADSGFDTAAKRQKIESLIREHEQDVEATKELSVDSLVECLLARIKKRSQVVAEELDLPSLSPELQELNASKCAQRVLGAQQAVNFVKEQLTDLEDVLTGDKRRNSKRQAAREEQKQTSKPEPTPIDAGNELAASFSGGSDDYESTSDLDADPATRLSRPASKFVGSLDQGFSDVSMSDDNDDDNDDDSDDGNGKCGQRQLVGSKQRKRTRNPDEYDEQADKEFMALYHGSDTVRPKNRPGQRQRRRQYEREYGQEANHIKIWQKEKKPRNDFKSQRQPHSASAKPAKDTRPNAKDQKLHPSWEAKRREKELLEQAKSIKGQKIVFT